MQHLFLSHCNNGYACAPECYVTHTLPVLFFFVTQQPKSGLRSLTVEVSRLHTGTISRLDSSERLNSWSQTPLPTQHTAKRQTSMPSVGFELAISATKLLQTCAYDSTTGTGKRGIMRPMWYGASATLLRVSATEDHSRPTKSLDKQQWQTWGVTYIDWLENKEKWHCSKMTRNFDSSKATCNTTTPGRCWQFQFCRRLHSGYHRRKVLFHTGSTFSSIGCS